jgi:hypothetical protein
MIIVGPVFTCTTVSTLQPVASVYLICAVPTATPLTIPVDDPTMAIPVVPELHTPPVVASCSVVVLPTHRFVLPVTRAGKGFTVNATVVLQPDGNV